MAHVTQNVLSAIQHPTHPLALNENVIETTTIISNIVAGFNDKIPQAVHAQGVEILRELSEHANKLSEGQSSMPEVSKELGQTIARSSLAVANVMKGLMRL